MMSLQRAHPVILTCHPDTPSAAVQRIAAEVTRSDETLTVSYTLAADFERLAMPTSCLPDEPLWQHTCFELFVAREDASSYRELNFAPSLDWASYAFRAYRELALDAAPLPPPRLSAHRSSHVFTLEAVLQLPPFGPLDPWTSLRLGICAVVEEREGALSYWALRHAAGKPDFHHRDAFALVLAGPREHVCAAEAK